MNRSYSKIRHIQESNLMLENRRLVENNRLFLMEGNEKSINNELINNYVNAVRAAFPEYKSSDGFRDASQGNGKEATIFGQTFYTVPLTLPTQTKQVLSFLSAIQNRVIGIGDPNKNQQASCIRSIRKGNEQFQEGHGCFDFQNTNKANFPKYAAMNAAYDNLYNNIRSIQK